jgi:hypothetical protein
MKTKKTPPFWLFALYTFIAVSSLFFALNVGTGTEAVFKITVLLVGLILSLRLIRNLGRKGWLYGISIMFVVLLLTILVRLNLDGSQLLYDFGEERCERKWAVIVINPFTQRVTEPEIKMDHVLDFSVSGFAGTLYCHGSLKLQDDELIRFIRPDLRRGLRNYRVSSRFNEIVREILAAYITSNFDALKSELREKINNDIESHFRELGELGFTVESDIKSVRVTLEKDFG